MSFWTLTPPDKYPRRHSARYPNGMQLQVRLIMQGTEVTHICKCTDHRCYTIPRSRPRDRLLDRTGVIACFDKRTAVLPAQVKAATSMQSATPRYRTRPKTSTSHGQRDAVGYMTMQYFYIWVQLC